MLSLLASLGEEGKILREICSVVLPDFHDRSLGAISAKLKDKRVLLVIDDLERAKFEIIMAMLPLFERLKRISHLTVICALAEDELCDVFRREGANVDRVYGHLNKLFDIRVEMPRLSESAIAHFQERLFADKFNDCRLVKDFFQKNHLLFDNPRQLIRVTEKLACIERQYYDKFPDKWDGGKVNMLEHREQLRYVFLVETLRLACPGVLKEIGMERGLSDYLKKWPEKHLSADSEIFMKKMLPETYEALKKKGVAQQILSALHHDRNDDQCDMRYRYAVEGQYTRCAAIHPWEAEEICISNENKNVSFAKQAENYFQSRGEEVEKPFLPACASGLFEYAWSLAFSSEARKNYLKNSLEEEIKLQLENNVRWDSALLSSSSYANQIINVCKPDKDVKPYHPDMKLFMNYKDNLIQLYSLMNLGEQAHVLTVHFAQMERRKKGEEETSEKGRKIRSLLEMGDDYEAFIMELCQQYAKSLCRHIFKFGASYTKENYDFHYQAYRTAPEKYMECFRRGMCEYIGTCPDALQFLGNWIDFMGRKYVNPAYYSGATSSFAQSETVSMMNSLHKELIEQKNVYQNLTPTQKEDLKGRCEASIQNLEEDWKSWRGNGGAQEGIHISGIEGFIELLQKILEKLKMESA